MKIHSASIVIIRMYVYMYKIKKQDYLYNLNIWKTFEVKIHNNFLIIIIVIVVICNIISNNY